MKSRHGKVMLIRVMKFHVYSMMLLWAKIFHSVNSTNVIEIIKLQASKKAL